MLILKVQCFENTAVKHWSLMTDHDYFNLVTLTTIDCIAELVGIVSSMGMLDGGMNCRQVARHFGYSPSTITRLLQRHRETGSVNDRPCSGCERVIDS